MENVIVLKKTTRDGKNLINHNRFTYIVKYEGSKSILYWCTLNRSNESDCSTKLRVYMATCFQ